MDNLWGPDLEVNLGTELAPLRTTQAMVRMPNQLKHTYN